MDIVTLIQEKKYLGREFLTWLWFQSDMNLGEITLEDATKFEIWLDNRVILEPDDEESGEKVICHGEHSEMYEARQALGQGKKITQARFKLSLNDQDWSFTLDDIWLNFKTCKTPKVMLDKGEDPEGLFFEKTFLIQEAVRLVEQLFFHFLKLRLSPEWQDTHLAAIKKWVHQPIPDKPEPERS